MAQRKRLGWFVLVLLLGPVGSITAQETVVDDLIVQGQACIGADCESGDGTGAALNIKEFGNYQIKFDALNCCVPSERVWALQANDPVNVTGDFLIRDLTEDTVPFRVGAGAPDDALTILYNGNIGVGTSTPGEKLHVFSSADANTLLTVENSNTGLNAVGVVRAKSNSAIVNLVAHGNGRTLSRFGKTLASWSEVLQVSGNGLIVGTLADKPLILGTNNTNRLEIGGTGGVTVNGNLTVTGTFSNPSSRELKESFEPVDPRTVLDKLARLPIQEWSYKSDTGKLRHIGPTVEDFRATFGLGTEGQYIFPMDVQGVTMTAVQGLYQLVQEKDAQIADLQKELREIRRLLLERNAEAAPNP